MAVVADAVAAAAVRLAAAGVPEPRADAEVLAAAALGTSRAGLVVAARDQLPPAPGARLAALVARRAAREPVQHLVGEWEFWSLPFQVDRRVLVPRPETELVVETALAVAPEARRILDLGTGSGILATVLARELPAATVWATDVDRDALAVARTNLARHAPGVRLIQADLLTAFRAAAFDLIVANPPYCAEGDLPRLAPEVRDHDPRIALAAGPDGLSILRKIVATAPGALVPGGWLVVELGAGQSEALQPYLERTRAYAAPKLQRDAAGIDRVLAVRVLSTRRPGAGVDEWVGLLARADPRAREETPVPGRRARQRGEGRRTWTR